MATTPFSPGLLPTNNPISQWVAPRRNALLGFGAGMLSPGLGGAATGAMQGMALDRQYADDAAAKAKLENNSNATRSWLEQQGFTDLVPLVDAGQAEIAYSEALKRMQPGYGQAEPVKPIEVNGQLVNPMTGAVIGDYRDPMSAMGDAPSGYRYDQSGNLSFIPGGPADPSTQAKTTEAQRRNQQLASVIQPELQSVEQNWDALADGGNQTWGSNPVTAGMASPEYQQARNSLAVIAQSYLYSVSGAAATDAEVQKIVDSVTPKPFESPQSIAAKKARIQQMADAVIQAGGGAPSAAPLPGGQTSTGLQWSLEP